MENLVKGFFFGYTVFIMSSPTFYSIAVGIIFGIIFGIFVPDGQIIHYWWVIIIGLGIWILLCKKLFSIKYILFISIITVIGGISGFYRVQQFHIIYPFNSFNQYNGKIITVVGNIDQSPILKPGKQQLRIKPRIINGEIIPDSSLRIVIKVSDLESFSYGDKVVFSGKFSLRKDFVSDTGRTVQYRLMSYSKRIIGDVGFPKIIEHEPGSWSILKFFSNIKQIFIQSLYKLFYSPASGLLAGIMIGDTSTLDNSFLNIFRAVGLIHIVVLSGYNITLVANFFTRAFARFGYYRRLIMAMIALVLFILIVGISQTALRAGIMALCAFSARYFIRPYMVLRGIVLALVIMVLISPYALLFDLSLQLSFLATIGIVFLFPLLQEKFPKLSEHFFGEILVQTIAVNILTLPIIIYQMGYFSLISFPINVLVLGLMPIITISGFLTVFIGMILYPLGQIIALPVQYITDIIIAVATFASAHDPFKFSFTPFSVWWILVIYFFIFIWVIRQNRIKVAPID
jgi:competence protein ComEC